jgi:hypothetical protein
VAEPDDPATYVTIEDIDTTRRDETVVRQGSAAD